MCGIVGMAAQLGAPNEVISCHLSVYMSNRAMPWTE